MDDRPTADGVEVLANRAWEDLLAARAQYPEVVPQDCSPVLFFGDLEAYRQSQLGVVTVGLNPSTREFPPEGPWQRFPGADQREHYVEALCRYFEVLPLNWFSCFRQLLLGVNASFYSGTANRALHTDICSAVPTDPTWSKLPASVKQALAARGIEAWHRLIAELQPDVIVIGVGYSWLSHISFEVLSPWSPLYTVERANPYVVERRYIRLPDGKTTLLVRGPAANTPFGKISNIDRYAVGQAILEAL